MKRIEAEFQEIIEPIVDGKTGTIVREHKPAVDRMYALWHMRARYRELESQELRFNGNVGDNLQRSRKKISKRTATCLREKAEQCRLGSSTD